MKKKYIYITSFLLLILIFRSTLYAQSCDPTKWKYFKILVTVSDDSIFTKLQDDVKMEMPYLTSYTLNVDIRSNDPQEQVIIFGDKDKKDSPRFNWSILRPEVQAGLLKWNKVNKIYLE